MTKKIVKLVQVTEQGDILLFPTSDGKEWFINNADKYRFIKDSVTVAGKDLLCYRYSGTMPRDKKIFSSIEYMWRDNVLKLSLYVPNQGSRDMVELPIEVNQDKVG